MPFTHLGQSEAILNSDLIALALFSDHHLAGVNRAMERLFGFRPGELDAKPIQYLFSDEAACRAFERQLEVLDEAAPVWQGEVPMQRRNGELGWFEVRVVRFAGHTNTLMATFVDRTLQHQALARLSLQDGILSSILDGVNIVSRDGRIRYTNPAFDRMFGYAEGELIGQSTAVLNYESDSAATEATILAGLERTGRWQGEIPNRRKDGTLFWTDALILAYDCPEWGPAWLSVQRESTQHHQMRVALEESEARYRSVAEDQTEVISRFLPDGTFVFVNQAYCQMFGKSAAELLGQRWHPVAHPDDLPMIEAQLTEMTPAQPVVRIENRVYTGRGELRWMEFVNRGFYAAGGRLREIQSVGWDITQRKEAELALRASEDRLDLALKGSGQVLWDWHLAEGRSHVGDRLSELLGYAPGEIGADSDRWIGLIAPRDRGSFEAAVRAHLEGETPLFFCAYRLRHRAGHWVRVEARGKVTQWDASGRPVRMIGTVLDVSERQRLNEEGMVLLGRIEQLIREATGSTPPLPVDKTPEPSDTAGLARLSRRQRQILGMIASGLTSAEIATRLKLAVNTVISHRRALMARLELHSTAEVTRFAMQHGLGLERTTLTASQPDFKAKKS